MATAMLPLSVFALCVCACIVAPVRAEGGRPVIKTDVTKVDGLGGMVQVSWSDVEFTRSGDWIGLWPATANLTLFSAPIKFKYLMSDPTACNYIKSEDECKDKSQCKWEPVWHGKPARCAAGTPASNGTISMYVANLREDLMFYYITGNIQFPEIVAKSDPIVIAEPLIPRGAHLALGDDPSMMRVYWQAGVADKPGVKYGTTSGSLDKTVEGSADPGRQYTPEDMCDRQVQPAARQGWIAPGSLLSATMVDLTPGATYYYQYGDDATGWSKEKSFVAAPATDPKRPTVIAAFGDMGQTESDGSWHHSWDFQDRGELPSQNTTDRLVEDKESEMILHIGDISYAVGFMSQWDNFFRQVEPVAAHKPWQASIGNHEQGWSGSFIPGTDSGGECGVPFNAHFPFASQDPSSTTPFSQRQPWYSFTYGPVAFIQMSTEHDFCIGSPQHDWVKKALAAVDRSKTPWIVFSGHRPMYVGSDWTSDTGTAHELRVAYESLLQQYKVDVAVWGHNHSYQKFCRMLNGTCTPANSTSYPGVQHLVIGMAGYDHSDCPRRNIPKTMQMCNDDDWGYTRMMFDSDKKLRILFISGATGKVLDTVDVTRNY